MSIVLHHSPQTRSSRLIWLLEELGADYEVNYVDIRRSNNEGHPDPANPHPLKKVPALTVDGHVLTESVLIFLYLTDRYPQACMAPTTTHPQRTEYLEWLGLYNTVLETVLSVGSPSSWSEIQQQAYDDLGRRWSKAISEGGFILGQFSALDILFGSLLQWYRAAMPAGDPYDSYLKRISERPALARTMAKDSPPEA